MVSCLTNYLQLESLEIVFALERSWSMFPNPAPRRTLRRSDIGTHFPILRQLTERSPIPQFPTPLHVGHSEEATLVHRFMVPVLSDGSSAQLSARYSYTLVLGCRIVVKKEKNDFILAVFLTSYR